MKFIVFLLSVVSAVSLADSINPAQVISDTISAVERAKLNELNLKNVTKYKIVDVSDHTEFQFVGYVYHKPTVLGYCAIEKYEFSLQSLMENRLPSPSRMLNFEVSEACEDVWPSRYVESENLPDGVVMLIINALNKHKSNPKSNSLEFSGLYDISHEERVVRLKDISDSSLISAKLVKISTANIDVIEIGLLDQDEKKVHKYYISIVDNGLEIIGHVASQ